MKHKAIIQPVPKELVVKELTKASFLKKSRRGSFEIYTFNATDCPLLMKEVGRLRELAFRHTGGGTGNEIDVDHFDNLFEQIILWNPDAQEIVGGYRIQLMKKLYLAYCAENVPLATYFDLNDHSTKKERSHFGFTKAVCQFGKNLFTLKRKYPAIWKEFIQLLKSIIPVKIYSANSYDFSPLATYFRLNDRFMRKYMPYSAELGRAFIQPNYQVSSEKKSIFALESLFEGLGSWIGKQNNSFTLSWKHPVTFLLGKITLYPSKFGDLDPIYHFIDMYFPAKHNDLIKPKGKYGCVRPYANLAPDVVFTGTFKIDFIMIAHKFLAPMLINQYGRLSTNMQCFGTVINKDFGSTEETAMMIKVPNIYVEFLKRYHILMEKEESE